MWVLSSVGRAADCYSVGRVFEPLRTHHSQNQKANSAGLAIFLRNRQCPRGCGTGCGGQGSSEPPRFSARPRPVLLTCSKMRWPGGALLLCTTSTYARQSVRHRADRCGIEPAEQHFLLVPRPRQFVFLQPDQAQGARLLAREDGLHHGRHKAREPQQFVDRGRVQPLPGGHFAAAFPRSFGGAPEKRMGWTIGRQTSKDGGIPRRLRDPERDRRGTGGGLKQHHVAPVRMCAGIVTMTTVWLSSSQK